MEKQASNTFVGGLITDRHPLASQNTELIDAQNIDLLAVGEGYQLILQKREGNVVVPDGSLPVGYVPLAVKEFNNIAYIISYDTDSKDTELGTFPSPDYAGFKYETGANIPGAVNVAVGEWDDRVDPPEYEFVLTPIAGSGTDDALAYIDGTATTLAHANFKIKNNGTLSDEYSFTYATVPVDMYVEGIEFNPLTETLTLGPTMEATVTFKQPWDSGYNNEPNIQYNTTITIASLEGGVASQTYNFKWHYATVVGFRINADPYAFTGGTVVGNTIPYQGGTSTINWITNDPHLVMTTNFSADAHFTPHLDAWPGVSDSATVTVGAGTIQLIVAQENSTANMAVNLTRGANFTATGTYPAHTIYAGGTVSKDISITQLHEV